MWPPSSSNFHEVHGPCLWTNRKLPSSSRLFDRSTKGLADCIRSLCNRAAWGTSWMPCGPVTDGTLQAIKHAGVFLAVIAAKRGSRVERRRTRHLMRGTRSSKPLQKHCKLPPDQTSTSTSGSAAQERCRLRLRRGAKAVRIPALEEVRPGDQAEGISSPRLPMIRCSIVLSCPSSGTQLAAELCLDHSGQMMGSLSTAPSRPVKDFSAA